MKIISLRWRHGSSDFVHVICNGDVSKAQFDKLKKADKLRQFDISEFSTDSFADALNYIETETETTEKTLKEGQANSRYKGEIYAEEQ